MQFCMAKFLQISYRTPNAFSKAVTYTYILTPIRFRILKDDYFHTYRGMNFYMPAS